MIDASLATPAAPAIIRREDYRPPAWRVPEIALDFDLGLTATRVTARLAISRNVNASGSEPIRLNGDGIRPLSVRLDGAEP